MNCHNNHSKVRDTDRATPLLIRLHSRKAPGAAPVIRTRNLIAHVQNNNFYQNSAYIVQRAQFSVGF